MKKYKNIDEQLPHFSDIYIDSFEKLLSQNCAGPQIQGSVYQCRGFHWMRDSSIDAIHLPRIQQIRSDITKSSGTKITMEEAIWIYKWAGATCSYLASQHLTAKLCDQRYQMLKEFMKLPWVNNSGFKLFGTRKDLVGNDPSNFVISLHPQQPGTFLYQTLVREGNIYYSRDDKDNAMYLSLTLPLTRTAKFREARQLFAHLTSFIKQDIQTKTNMPVGRWNPLEPDPRQYAEVYVNTGRSPREAYRSISDFYFFQLRDDTDRDRKSKQLTEEWMSRMIQEMMKLGWKPSPPAGTSKPSGTIQYNPNTEYDQITFEEDHYGSLNV